MGEEIRFSLSSEEDVYDLLHQMSYIYEGKEQDEEMFSIHYDFVRILDEMEDNQYIKVYYDLQVGNISRLSGMSSIVGQSAVLLGISEDKFNEGLEKNVEEVVELNKEKWLRYVNKKYRNVYFDEEFEKQVVKDVEEDKCDVGEAESDVEVEEVKEVEKEVVLSKKRQEQKDRDLLPLYEQEEELAKRIDKLTKQGKKDTTECRKLVTIRIQVRKDINVIRRSYGEVLGSQNRHGARTFTPYDGENPEYRFIVEAHEKKAEEERQDIFDEFKKEKMLEQVKEVAKNVLTKQQYLIFEFYYFNEMTQQEIGDLMGIKRNTVSEHLTRAINNIKKKMYKTRTF